jgi:regulator of nucleoside diphosphate kinase
MTKQLHCLLTTRDYAMLEGLVDSGVHLADGVAVLARRKLASAMIVFPDDVPPGVATVNSRIVFRVDDGPAETRVLVRDDTQRAADPTLRIDTLRGLALLGLEAGDHYTLQRPDERSETIHLEGVAYQPEAAARALAERNVVRLDSVRRRPAPLVPAGGDDDPGPHAA